MAETTILVAESQNSIVRDLRKHLSSLGYRSISFVTKGEEAIETAEKMKPDLALVSLRLPGEIDGIQVVKELSAQGTATVFLGDQSDQNLLSESGDRKSYEYLLKPFTERELQLVIEAALLNQNVGQVEDSYQRYFPLYLEGTNLILWDWDIAGRTITVNPFGAQWFGYEAQRQPFSVEEWDKLVHVDDLAEVRNMLNAHITEGSPYFESEHRMLAHDQEWKWVLMRGKVVDYDSRGKPVRMLGTAREINPRKLAEQALMDNERRLRWITDHMADVVGEVDADGVLQNISSSVQRVLGYPPDQVIGASVFDYLHEDYVDRVSELLEKTLSHHQEGRLELRLRHREDYYLWIEGFGKPLTDGEGKTKGVVFSARDITERKNADHALRNLNQRLTDWVEDLERRNRQVDLTNEMGEWLQSCRDIQEAYSIVGQFVQKIFWDTSGALYFRSPDQELFKAITVWGESPPYGLVFDPQECWALRRMRLHYAADATALLFCEHVFGAERINRLSNGDGGTLQDRSATIIPETFDFRPYLCAPLIIQGDARGLLHLQVAPDQSIRYWEQLAQTLSERVALALSNLELQATLRAQAIRDPLTGLFNRRYMEETLTRELRRAVRFKRPLGVVMLDIDHFKRFNDEFSYAAGDVLLQAIGEFLQSNMRMEDVVCRFGGEEFVLILPEASFEDTIRRAEQIRKGVRNLQVQHKGMQLGAVTISLGVAAYPENGDNAENILSAVDSALHGAKNAGRNTLVVAGR